MQRRTQGTNNVLEKFSSSTYYPGDLGGGPYDRLESLNDFELTSDTWIAFVSSWLDADDKVAMHFTTLQEALKEWNAVAEEWNPEFRAGSWSSETLARRILLILAGVTLIAARMS